MPPKPKKPHTYSIRILLPNGEVLDLHNVDNSFKLSEVKVLIEHDLGIPTELYRLSYLDKADLLSNCTLAQHEIVPRARVNLRPWKMWEGVLSLAFSGLVADLDEVKVIGSDEQSKYRASNALFIAAHRGHCRLVEKLLRLTNVDINTQTKTKWTALHAAARTNQWRCLCILIDKGADIMLTDNNGKTALDLAKMYGAKKCEQSLNFCSWNLQKYNQVDRWQKDYTPYKLRDLNVRLAHQSIDSSNPAWMKGPFQTRYLAVRDNSVSVKKCREWESDSSKYLNTPTVKSDQKFNYGWFDPQRAKEFIPDTQTMLTFSDPTARLKMPKRLTTQIHSLQKREIRQGCEDKNKPTYSEWLADKIKNERELTEENRVRKQKEGEANLREKKERESKSEMSYLRWMHDVEIRKEK